MTCRPATFTEANAWVHIEPDQFARHFPHVSSIWQAEDGRVWAETDGASKPDPPELTWWELEAERSAEPVLPCGCRVRVHYAPHARETICTFSNPSTGFHAKLRISGRLMLTTGAVSRIGEALCVHPHDEETVVQHLERPLSESR